MKFLGKQSCVGIGCCSRIPRWNSWQASHKQGDAKSIYTPQPVLCCSLVETTTTLRENCEDIHEDAMDM